MLQYKRKRWFNVQYPLPVSELKKSQMGGFAQLPTSTSMETTSYEMGPSPPMSHLLKENENENESLSSLLCENESFPPSLCEEESLSSLLCENESLPPSFLLSKCENESLPPSFLLSKSLPPSLCEEDSFPPLENDSSLSLSCEDKSLPILPENKCLKIEEIWNEIKENEDELTHLVKIIGSYFGDLLSSMTLTSQKITVEQMMNSSLQEEYEKFPRLIVILFEQMTVSKTNFREESHRKSAQEKKIQMTHCCLNTLLKCRDLRSISTFSLSISLYIYWISRSKVLLNVLSHFGVTVSYSTVQAYERRFAAALPPNVDHLNTSDFVVWFDNLQKSWCSTRTSIINTAAHIAVITNIVTFRYPGSQLSRQPSLHPSSWRWNSCATIQNFLLNETQAYMLNTFLESFLDKIFSAEISGEQSETVTRLMNAQDDDVLNHNTKECPKCHKRFKRTSQKCYDCDARLPTVGDRVVVPSSSMQLLKSSVLPKKDQNFVTMYTIKEGQLEKSLPIPLESVGIPPLSKPFPFEKHDKVVFLDPESGNPSSYVVVERILNNLVTTFPERSFLPVCVDGSPLRLMESFTNPKPKS
jgi:hypothetical protein